MAAIGHSKKLSRTAKTGLSGDPVSARGQPHAPGLRTGVTRHFGHLI
jgi:hypothetical protein